MGISDCGLTSVSTHPAHLGVLGLVGKTLSVRGKKSFFLTLKLS